MKVRGSPATINLTAPWTLSCVLPIAENTTFNSSSEAERKTRRFYLSCLQLERIEKLGAQPLRDLIDKAGALGGLRARGARGPGCGPGKL